MYGISNSQQQGSGGGGGAASYKAIKSSIAPSDWQEVANQPYFVGENAMEWAVNEYREHEKSQTTKLGLVLGKSYAITAVCDGQTYTQTAVAEGDEVDGIGVYYELSPDMYVDIYDDNTGSGCSIDGEATSFVITKFEGEGVGKSIQATIADSAIKVNSAVTMYVDYDGKMTAIKKIDGSLTVSVPTMPTEDISYAIEIVDTNVEGLFEVINNNFPLIPEIPASLPQTVYGWYGKSISPSAWTKGTHTDGSDYYFYRFDVENLFDNTDALFRVNYAGYIEISPKSASGNGTVTMDVTVDKLPTKELYIYYRLGEISGSGSLGSNITVVNEFSGYITDKPDHLYLTDTATGTLYEVTVANGTISLVAQSST